MLDTSESETLGLRTRLRGVGSGRGFLGGRPRPRFTGCVGVAVVVVVALTVAFVVDFVIEEEQEEEEEAARVSLRLSLSLLGPSSAEETSSTDATILRFREAGVMASSLISFLGVTGPGTFLALACPTVLETRAKLLMVDDAC